ncbi:class III signal peptide-containing protein [Candidatus Micrarchaeota archaeon]|nr:class III signal peptide-containing protein [Candidatus Micrarchaeota archaeon]
MKGQISAEMLIILAIVLAVAVFLAVQLMGMTEKFGDTINQTSKVLDCQTAGLIQGSFCFDDVDCGDGNPSTWKCENSKCVLKGPCS